MRRIVLLPEPLDPSRPNDFPIFDGEGYATHGNAGAIALHKALDDNNVRLRHGITASLRRNRATRRLRGPFYVRTTSIL